MILRLKLCWYVSLMFITLFIQVAIGLALLPIWILLWVVFGISANDFSNRIQRWILDKTLELDRQLK